MAFDFSGHVDLRDVAVDSSVLVVAFVDDRRAEGITDLGIGAGQRVV
jgi:hypothetical protein